MKLLLPLTIVSAMLLAGCAHLPQGQASHTIKSKLHAYQCESGESISVAYPSTDLAAVQYKGKIYSMTLAVSASGSRYVGQGLEWWSKGMDKGSEGSLFEHLADETTGDHVESCVKR